MNCPDCGTELVSGAAFCHACGSRLQGRDGGAPQAATGQTRPAARAVGAAEETLWEGSYAAKAMTPRWILGGVATIAAIAVALWLGQWWWVPLAAALAMWVILGVWFVYVQLANHYRLTNQRFVHQRGILVRVTNPIDLVRVLDTSFTQNIIERMLGVGRITLVHNDRDDGVNETLVLDGIDDVQQIAALIDKVRREERLRRGLEAMGQVMEHHA